ncbi:penicillin-binding protein activator [Novosphingobium sp. TH158]|uniref:penicillin-binding protein activator n=1 Tax=Novosphingobium sp. TH158 TaxID=2067455 RepID=UPI000C7B682C|nr:penicillin-binding protein activator [Novosphingobium sp. TH158]PLK25909.1 penicillin-binding protein activator [Novosphingobium sp. TH158]
MFDWNVNKRQIMALGAVALLAGCKVIPKGVPETGPAPTSEPNANILPADQQRHRVALLVPTSGPNAGIGQALANAATMALLDTNATNLRITTYDTATGPSSAATRAIADGNKLILGPLLGDEVAAVAQVARPARVPIISFSNDGSVAGRDVFIMGSLPNQSITRTVNWARSQGARRFGALLPDGEYGLRAAASLNTAVAEAGGTVVASETFARSNPSIISAAKRLKAKGQFDAVLVADGSRFAVLAAPQLRPKGIGPRLLGTELWSGDSAIVSSAALRGAWYSAVSDGRFRQYADSYRNRFGNQPYRISTMGYDAVLLTLRVAKIWKPGTLFPTAKLYDREGFLGLDGVFRFGDNGVVERALEVVELRQGGVSVVSPAPARFAP